MTVDRPVEIAVIGGSGLYALFDGEQAGAHGEVRELTVDTPYGTPSGAVTVGRIGGRDVAFLPRHGPGHRFPAHRINYRANIAALHQLGVRTVLAPCAVGSLRAELGPGTFVLPDQILDQTRGRISTFFDEGAHHVGFADPYCAVGSAAVARAAAAVDRPAQLGGTMVVIEGPRFSTRAESRFFAAMGGSIINMTGMPEAVLAREQGLCYTAIALVTDHDAGVEAGEGVHQDDVFAQFEANIGRLRLIVERAVTELPEHPGCSGVDVLDG